jgi:hypothetical protein
VQFAGGCSAGKRRTFPSSSCATAKSLFHAFYGVAYHLVLGTSKCHDERVQLDEPFERVVY